VVVHEGFRHRVGSFAICDRRENGAGRVLLR